MNYTNKTLRSYKYIQNHRVEIIIVQLRDFWKWLYIFTWCQSTSTTGFPAIEMHELRKSDTMSFSFPFITPIKLIPASLWENYLASVLKAIEVKICIFAFILWNQLVLDTYLWFTSSARFHAYYAHEGIRRMRSCATLRSDFYKRLTSFVVILTFIISSHVRY